MPPPAPPPDPEPPPPPPPALLLPLSLPAKALRPPAEPSEKEADMRRDWCCPASADVTASMPLSSYSLPPPSPAVTSCPHRKERGASPASEDRPGTDAGRRTCFKPAGTNSPAEETLAEAPVLKGQVYAPALLRDLAWAATTQHNTPRGLRGPPWLGSTNTQGLCGVRPGLGSTTHPGTVRGPPWPGLHNTTQHTQGLCGVRPGLGSTTQETTTRGVRGDLASQRTWKRKASPRELLRQNTKSFLGCSGTACTMLPSAQTACFGALEVLDGEASGLPDGALGDREQRLRLAELAMLSSSPLSAEPASSSSSSSSSPAVRHELISSSCRKFS
ncbi:LOW QUALITY PROTEIN: hypothetical protein CRUP_014561 [Coryphaenoides rupestris]|nr:LOW QUALITY PROTEIN: hypothetical protein CRUP_014561 [Coryphaenoides rupestris]